MTKPKKKKALVGQHLMRVRIRTSIFEEMQVIVEEQSISSRRHVTVSDFVRAACYNAILLYYSAQDLENMAPEELDAETLIIDDAPLFRRALNDGATSLDHPEIALAQGSKGRRG